MLSPVTLHTTKMHQKMYTVAAFSLTLMRIYNARNAVTLRGAWTASP